MGQQGVSLRTLLMAPDRVEKARPLGRRLFDAGKISALDLLRALDRQTHVDAPLGAILAADGLVNGDDIAHAVADQHGLYLANLAEDPPDPDLAELAPRAVWLTHMAVPWMRVGGALMIATARPDQFDALKSALPVNAPPVLPVVASEHAIMAALAQVFRTELTALAERRVDPAFSCRHWHGLTKRKCLAVLVALVGTALAAIIAPAIVISALFVMSVAGLLLIATLKITGAVTQIRNGAHRPPPVPTVGSGKWPRISVMVPLYQETEIAEALVRRLQRLTYPKVLLDVILVLEDKDALTRLTLSRCTLPHWIRVVEVPDGGGVTTKPRALNYALDFCKGDIIGIWDAEDAPAPDQLEQVAAHFARAEPDVVCLQGILDYYNPRSNWIARCFTLEYASWFRIVLPGLARLGLVIPLGGTTLFLRRAAIHEMGGWDAHNVTEDADLGIRIARFGYRTEFIATPTHEEANCRPWRWVKQRSRWLKGFMVTYAVHMRHPRKLLAELGLKRFLGVQAFFLGTLSQFLLAPVLWSFWLYALAVPHPTQGFIGPQFLMGCVVLFLALELVNLTIAMVAVARPESRFLIPWAITLPLYFPMGTLAAYKALYELLVKPFYWDKTQHGHAKPEAKSRVPRPI